MIHLISGRLRSTQPTLVDKMHRLRKAVFKDQLNWDVPVVGDWEIDEYDEMNPLYVLSVGADGDLIGGVRLLPTTGKNMLNDTFPSLLPDGERIESPLIWEMSRFTVKTCGDRRRDLMRVAQTTGELILAVNELGHRIGLSHYVCVIDAAMHRMFSFSGFAGDPIGPPQRIGVALTYAVTYELGDELTGKLLRVTGGRKPEFAAADIEGMHSRAHAA